MWIVASKGNAFIKWADGTVTYQLCPEKSSIITTLEKKQPNV
jgi:hypothetical protein